jgi:hypothetical protein
VPVFKDTSSGNTLNWQQIHQRLKKLTNFLSHEFAGQVI